MRLDSGEKEHDHVVRCWNLKTYTLHLSTPNSHTRNTPVYTHTWTWNWIWKQQCVTKCGSCPRKNSKEFYIPFFRKTNSPSSAPVFPVFSFPPPLFPLLGWTIKYDIQNTTHVFARIRTSSVSHSTKTDSPSSAPVFFVFSSPFCVCSPPRSKHQMWYGVATISRLLQIIGLFCKRAL